MQRPLSHYLNSPVPDWNESVNGTIELAGGRKFETAIGISGEIPWRDFSPLPENRSFYERDSLGWWRCTECSHLPDEHYPEPDEDDAYASYECSKCNCGNNSR